MLTGGWYTKELRGCFYSSIYLAKGHRSEWFSVLIKSLYKFHVLMRGTVSSLYRLYDALTIYYGKFFNLLWEILSQMHHTIPTIAKIRFSVCWKRDYLCFCCRVVIHALTLQICGNQKILTCISLSLEIAWLRELIS